MYFKFPLCRVFTLVCTVYFTSGQSESVPSGFKLTNERIVDRSITKRLIKAKALFLVFTKCYRKFCNCLKMSIKVQLNAENYATSPSEIHFDKICRTCMSTNKLNPIFKLSYNEKSFSTILQSCASVVVNLKLMPTLQNSKNYHFIGSGG